MGTNRLKGFTAIETRPVGGYYRLVAFDSATGRFCKTLRTKSASQIEREAHEAKAAKETERRTPSPLRRSRRRSRIETKQAHASAENHAPFPGVIAGLRRREPGGRHVLPVENQPHQIHQPEKREAEMDVRHFFVELQSLAFAEIPVQ